MSKRAWITVSDAGAKDGTQVKVTDLETQKSLVVENQADTVADAIRTLNREAK
jgi:hypothetical protein